LLHEYFGNELDFFVFYSSASVILSSPQLGSYAASNIFMDALAQFRRARGMAATSINWGFWAEAGMAAQAGAGGQNGNIAPKGMGAFTPAEAFGLLEKILSDDVTQITVMPFSLKEWAKYYSMSARSPFFALLAAPGATDFTSGGHGKSESGSELSFKARLKQEGSAATRARLLHDYVREQVARVLKLQPADVNPRLGVGEMGMDSLMTLELRNRLQSGLGLNLVAAVFFNYPTVEKLVPFLAGKMKLSLDTDGVDANTEDAAGAADAERQQAAAQRSNGGTGKVGIRVPRKTLAAVSLTGQERGAELEAEVAQMSPGEAEARLLEELSKFE
jgi:acyl carrier protein